MTQQDKELLLRDLCARLPYGVKVRTNRGPEIIEGLAPFCHNEVKIALNLDWSMSIDGFTPYLRPMSSMTEEEKQMMDSLWKDNNKLVFADPDEVRRYRFYDISVVDFLNSRHFDYRGLIEKGLALEAPEGMYTDDKFVPITKEELEKTRISSKDYLI